MRSILLAALALLCLWLPVTASAIAAEAPDFLAPDLVPGSIDVDRVSRQFLLHVPAGDPAGPRPLVVVLHGGAERGDALSVARLTGFHRLGAREGFATVYPNGVGNTWNDGRDGAFTLSRPSAGMDDVGFVVALVERLVRAGIADPRRVYLTGLSNGGMLTFRLACTHAGLFAAAAPVIAALPVFRSGTCRPSRPIPVLMINGDRDRFVPFDGGPVAGFLGQDRGAVHSVAESLAVFARVNGCGTSPMTVARRDAVPDDDTRLVMEDYPGCRDGASVRLYRVIGGGHTYANPDRPAAGPIVRRILGPGSREFDATEAIWAFFRDKLRNPEPARADR
ncbi:alpha/beta hydrolase family esterase [Oceanibacterium hippocampi]|uniref:Esterase PHB depolymerase n=1 Tax=Oceanibacterium hippocampi TaxID=745714 RepID=A0A1Y5TDI1_9PROT|nr:PHB depolymerase family esterase [Oceanibacterium hippocampi]SLN57923.1 Esterase PHB depolymerase [Oceanibacterium hippocampi]